jgi:hypothetical protein
MLSVPPTSTANVGTNNDFTAGVSTLQNPQFTCDVAGCYVLQLKAANAGSGYSDPDAVDQREVAQTAVYILSAKLGLRKPGYKLYRYDADLNQALTGLEDYVYLPGTKLVHVDGGRVDSYTADGTIYRPYKTIGDALTAITDNDASHRYCVYIAPGTYVEQITCKPYVDLIGASRYGVLISSSTGSYTLRGTAAIATGAARVEHMSIENTYASGGRAVDLSGAGILILSDIYAHSTNTHAIYSDTGKLTVHHSSVVSDSDDGLRAITSGSATIEQSYFEGDNDPGVAYDIYIGAGVDLFLDAGLQTGYWRWSFNGYTYLMTPSAAVGNNSSVAGDSVSDALDELAHFIPVNEHTASSVDLEDADGGTVRTNTGATAQVAFNLPTAAYGRKFTFVVSDAYNLRIVADTGDTIRIAGNVTPAAGYIEASTVGNTVTLVGMDATRWVAISHEGTWTFSS